ALTDRRRCRHRLRCSSPAFDLAAHRFRVAELKLRAASNVVPLGAVDCGHFYHRALLFKAFCDAVGLPPCALRRAEYGRAWNVVDARDLALAPALAKGVVLRFVDGASRAPDVSAPETNSQTSQAEAAASAPPPAAASLHSKEAQQSKSGGSNPAASAATKGAAAPPAPRPQQRDAVPAPAVTAASLPSVPGGPSQEAEAADADPAAEAATKAAVVQFLPGWEPPSRDVVCPDGRVVVDLVFEPGRLLAEGATRRRRIYVGTNHQSLCRMVANPYHAQVEDYQWYSIHVVALVVIFLSVSGSLSIIYLTAMKAAKESIHPIQMLPMFISMTDVFFGLFHGTDHLVSLALGRVLDGPGCVALGFGTVFSMNSTPFWVSACAVYMHLGIVHNKKPDVGPAAAWMHLACWGGPLAINIIALARGEFGPEIMWCGLPHSLGVYNTSVILAGLAVNIVIYAWTWAFIMRHSRSVSAMGAGSGSGSSSHGQQSDDSSASPLKNIRISRTKDEVAAEKPNPAVAAQRDAEKRFRKAANELPIFVLIYIVQWFPYAVYGVLLLYGVSTYWFNLTVVTLTNSGGIWNAIAYRKLVDRKK
ncbi:Armadillo repeat-containing protein 3, partial [Cladochytrium tenue]